MGRSSRRRFSIGEALNAPFALLKRRPLAVFAWGLLRFAFGAMVLAAMAPFFMTLAASAQSGVEPDFRHIMGLEASIQGLNLLGLVVALMVGNAAMRATWAKRGDGFAFLRLGMDELRVAIASIAIGGGFYLGVIVLALVGLSLAAALSNLGEQVMVPLMVAYGGFAILFAIWALARVILIVPVSLLDRSFAFERGWALGRGQGAKLAVTGFLAWLILIVVQMVFAAIAAGVIFMVARQSGVIWPDFGQTTPTVAELTALARPFLIPAAMLAIPAILLVGFQHAMFSAPLASAARQLSESGTPPAPVAVAPYDDGLSPILPAAAIMAAEADAGQGEPDSVESNHFQPSPAGPGPHAETHHGASQAEAHTPDVAHVAEDHGGHIGGAQAHPHEAEPDHGHYAAEDNGHQDDDHGHAHPKPGDGH